MSGGADELPDSDNADASSILSGTTAYINGDGSAGALLLGAVFGTMYSVFQGGINIIQSIIGFITNPIDEAGDATATTIEATITAPLSIVRSGADVSASSLGQFGVLGFVVGVVVLLAGFYVIIQFLEEPETSNTFIVPGFPDLPFIGVTEENEDEE